MSFLRRLFGAARGPSARAQHKEPAARSLSGPAFDPTILQRFEREIATWPPAQARIALQIIKATLDGTSGVIDTIYPELTASQLHATVNVLREMHGEPVEEDDAGTSASDEDAEADQESERIWREMVAMKIAAALEEKGIDPCHTFELWVGPTGDSCWIRSEDASRAPGISRLRGYTRTDTSRYGVPIYLNPGEDDDDKLVVTDVWPVDPAARAKRREARK